MSELTTVHLLRHGEVENPTGVLYGRLPGYRLSALGRQMAQRIAEHLTSVEIAKVVSSPLERAQETAAPIAAAHGLEIAVDERLIEAANVFEGLTFGVGDGALTQPTHWRYLYNPFRPSWGEPFRKQADRMLAAMADTREQVPGSAAVMVSHQCPIWVARSAIEGRHLWHDPRKRECSLASLTSVTYDGDRIVALTYSEPAHDLLPDKLKRFKPGA